MMLPARRLTTYVLPAARRVITRDATGPREVTPVDRHDVSSWHDVTQNW